MKERRFPLRFRTVLGLAFAGWVVFSMVWMTRRWRAVQIVTAARVMHVEWQYPTWTRGLDPKWARLLPGTRLSSVFLWQTNEQAGDIAWAIRVCGASEKLGASENTKSFLQALGYLPKVKSLTLQNVSMSDEEFLRLLGQFPGLVELVVPQGNFSGSNFPPLAKLQSVQMYNMPLTYEGLVAVLRCPALQSLKLSGTAMTLDQLRRIPQGREQPLQELTLYYDHPWSPPYYPLELKKPEAEELRGSLQRSWPGTKVVVERMAGP